MTEIFCTVHNSYGKTVISPLAIIAHAGGGDHHPMLKMDSRDSPTMVG